MARYINPKAKKYAGLRKKQATANKYLKQQKKELGKEHRYIKNALDKLDFFQKAHHLDKRPTFSMKGMTTKDVEAYEKLLDSIIDSTYTNPEKYAAHKENQLNFAIEQGWATTKEEAEDVYEFSNSEIVAELKDRGLGDVPSDLVEKYAEYVQANLKPEDFIDMAKLFEEGYSKNKIKADKFFEFADDYKTVVEISKRQENYGIRGSNKELFLEMVNDNILGSNDFKLNTLNYIISLVD